MSLGAAVGFMSSHSVDFELYTGFLGLMASVGNVPEPYITFIVGACSKLGLALIIDVGSSCQVASRRITWRAAQASGAPQSLLSCLWPESAGEGHGPWA